LALPLQNREEDLRKVLEIAEASGRCFVYAHRDDGVSQFGLGLAEQLRTQHMSVAVYPFLVYSPACYLAVLCDVLTQLGLFPGAVQNAYKKAERQRLSAATVMQSIGVGAEAEDMAFEDVQQTVVVHPAPEPVAWDDVVAAFHHTVQSAGSGTKWVILCGITRECPTPNIQNVLRGALWKNADRASSLRVVWCEENQSAPDWTDVGECHRLGRIGAKEAVNALRGEPARLSPAQAAAVVRQLLDESRTMRYVALELAANKEVLRRSWT